VPLGAPPQRPEPRYEPRQPQPSPPQPPPYAPPQQQRRAGAALVVDSTNQRYELRHGSNVIGRGTDADLQLLDQGVSRRHVDVQYDGQRATIYDLGSTNGTTVNGHEVGSHMLRHGDVVRVGHTRMVFNQDSA
jgi:pSer/pThr/pTyr-binding forkhead associated (FHA) protein